MNATVVFQNGEIVTIDKEETICQSVAIMENKIVAVGSNEEVSPWIGPATKVIDLKGKSLLPGFIDAHLHFVLYGVFQMNISCKDPGMQSLDAILTALQKRADATPRGQWIRAWGFNEAFVEEQRYPTREELDAVSTEHPIVISRTCSHIGIVNSKALELAHITDESVNPPGGLIERNEDGSLSGRLIENAYMQFNEVSGYTNKELEKAMLVAQQHFIEKGITSVHDAGTFDEESFRLMQLASQNGDLKIRIYAMISSLNDCKQFTLNMMKAGIVTGTGNDFFKVGPAKLFTDGSSTGPTIATRESYSSNPNDYGILYYTEDEIYDVLGEAHRKGYQITVHAQGDKAIELYLNVVERAINEYPRNNHRHRIEHAGISASDLQERMKNLGVIPIPNPPFPYEFGESYIHNYGERIHYMYPARDFLDLGIPCAAGSDAPVTTYNPMIGIHTAVNRKVNSGTEFGRQQRVSLLEAIRMYTYNAAFASFDEDKKGSIEVGKMADLIVADRALLQMLLENLKDVQIEMTMIDGKIVYEKSLSQV
ncbi:amidohydrolase [Cytobacillus horneckiae]|uniref:amidohydrolase n=1 Tax=Cytobacillus horneckiae TaxID=549687 RepID=UPI003D1FA4E1